MLVNNAGFGTYGSVAEVDSDRERELVAVNVDALVRLTHAVLPGMLDRGPRRHPECGFHHRLPAGAVSGDLRGVQGLRAVVQRGAVGRDEGLGRQGDRSVPGRRRGQVSWMRSRPT